MIKDQTIKVLLLLFVDLNVLSPCYNTKMFSTWEKAIFENLFNTFVNKSKYLNRNNGGLFLLEIDPNEFNRSTNNLTTIYLKTLFTVYASKWFATWLKGLSPYKLIDSSYESSQ